MELKTSILEHLNHFQHGGAGGGIRTHEPLQDRLLKRARIFINALRLWPSSATPAQERVVRVLASLLFSLVVPHFFSTICPFCGLIPDLRYSVKHELSYQLLNRIISVIM